MKIKFIKEYRALVGEALSGSATCAVGTVVDTTEKSAQWLIDNGFAEEVKESGWWKPKENEKYYFIDNNGDVETDRWYRSYVVDTSRFIIGNCFKTTRAAEDWRYYLKAVATVRQDEGVLTPEEFLDNIHNDEPTFFIGLDEDGAHEVWSLDDCKPIAGTIYFDTEDHARSSLGKHRDEWDTIANYDWSRE